VRTGKHVARLYSPPVLRYDYRGLRQIAKRLGWSVKRVLRTKQRDRTFPLSITFVGRQWCYVLYEERLQQWFTAGETVTRDHVLGLKGLSGAKMSPPPREGEPGPVSDEPTPAPQPVEELGGRRPKALEPIVEPSPSSVPSRCLVPDEPFRVDSGPTSREHEEPPARVESLLEPPGTEPPCPSVNQLLRRRRSGIKRIEGCVCSTGLNCTAHD